MVSKIVLTGASGLLGSAVLKILERNGGRVVLANRARVDLSDYNSTRDFFAEVRPNIVIHTAARVHGLMGNTRFPAEIFDENLRINSNVISCAYLAGVRRFALASTVAAYPGHLVENIREDQYFDGSPHAGESAYGHSKRAMLAQIEAYRRQYGVDYTYAIFTNLFGPSDRFDVENGHVVPSLIAKFHAARINGGPVRVWGKGIARRDFIYIADAAAALVHLAHVGSGCYNVATGQSVPIAQVVAHLSSITGVSDIHWESDKPEGQMERSYDVTRLRESGFMHRYSLEDGLRLAYNWYAQHYPDVRTS